MRNEYPFHSKKDVDLTEDRKMSNEVKENDKQNKRASSIKQASSTSHINKKNNSSPLILPTPKVADRQLKRTKHKSKEEDFKDQTALKESMTSSESMDNEKAVDKKELPSELAQNSEEKGSSTMNELPDMIEESLSLQDQFDDLHLGNEEAASLQEEFLAMLEEFSVELDDQPLMNNESLLDDDLFINKNPSKSNHFDSLVDEFIAMLKDDSSIEEEELKEEQSDNLLLKQNDNDNDSQKLSSLIVKLPLLLAVMNIDVDIFDSFELPLPISNIEKIEWSLESLDCQVVLPATTAFLKGILIADIQYVSNYSEKSLHTIKVPIPWGKIMNVDWINEPVLPDSSEKEFMFESHNGEEVSLHYEYYEKFAHPIYHDLQSVHFVSYEEVSEKIDTPTLSIQGRTTFCVHLLQLQYIDLYTAKISY